MPFQQLIGDCNPDAEYHWLNQRCIAKKTRRIYSRHADNPSLTPEYLKRLSNLTGVRRKRLFLGLWCAAEGQIWENYDPAIHILDADLTKNLATNRWHIWVYRWQQDIELGWFFASMDWGFRNPGCLGVWGVDKERRAYLVHQVYQSGRNHDWWAAKAEGLRKTYDIQRFSCDDADAAGIDLFNHRMYWIAQPVGKKPNDFGASASIVRERLGNQTLFFLRSNLESRDPELIEAKKPCSVEEEIPSYVYRELKDGQAVKEEPAPDSDDHGCDMARYGMMFLDRNDWQPNPIESKFKSGSYGKILNHDAVFAKIRERQEA
jgi:phage terminase large subunit